MVALVSVLAVVLLSLIITRVATLALAMTGMSRESARFQARSALSGVGFTTSEAEAVVSHPVRRRIVLGLMVVGSAGLVTAVASLIVSFGGVGTGAKLERAAILLGGLVALWLVSRSARVDRALAAVIRPVLRSRGLDARDYAALLDLEGDFAVSELLVEPGDWIAGRTLAQLRLRDEGVVVLGIHRPAGAYVGLPHGEHRIEPGDTLVLYGRGGRVAELDRRGRAEGDAAHVRALAEEASATPQQAR